MPRAGRRCPVRPCPEITSGGPCRVHAREAEQRRGSARAASQRGYDRAHDAFRDAVLARDPLCVLCSAAPSLIADHYPLSRRELVELGRDPNDPSAGRGLCRSCDSKQTAQRQPGGFNARC